ncbi:MAG: glycosyltransferase family 39 protein [Anaerolineales bacterium]|nr:glycosyltransferase family 39 protein [Anaerolineales bacterium]
MEEKIFGNVNYKVVAFIVVLIAVIIRGWNLAQIPNGFWSDEAINALTGISALENHELKVFFDVYFGRESLFIYLVGISTKIFGNHFWAARLPSVISGALSILGIYLFAKELYDREIGLLAAVLLAGSFWHLVFSRIAFRAILVPTFISFSLFFLLRGIRTSKIQNYIIGGVVFGLGFYSYISFRIMPVILLGWLPFCIYVIVQSKQDRNKNLFGLGSYLLVTILVSFPLGMYFLDHPDMFWSRMDSVADIRSEYLIPSIFRNLFLSLKMFTSVGDLNPRHNIPGRPVFSIPEAIIFWAGFIFLFLMIFLSLRGKKFGDAGKNLLVVALWIGNLLPAVFSSETPHFLRTLGAVVPTYIIFAVGVKYLGISIKNIIKKYPHHQIIVSALIVGGLMILTGKNLDAYFYRYANQPETAFAFQRRYVEIGNLINSIPEQTTKFVLLDSLEANPEAYNFSHYANTIVFTLDSPEDTILIKSEELNQAEFVGMGNYIFIPMENSSKWVEVLTEKLQINLKDVYSEEGIQIIYPQETDFSFP